MAYAERRQPFEAFKGRAHCVDVPYDAIEVEVIEFDAYDINSQLLHAGIWRLRRRRVHSIRPHIADFEIDLVSVDRSEECWRDTSKATFAFEDFSFQRPISLNEAIHSSFVMGQCLLFCS